VEVVRTDVAALIGIAARGPLHIPTRIESWTGFVTRFGKHLPNGYLAYAVEGFFANGGRACWVVRVADPAEACPAALDILGPTGWPVFRLVASSPGTWGQDLVVTLTRNPGDRFSLRLELPGEGQEFWPGLSLDPKDERYVREVLKAQGGSLFVHAREPGMPVPGPYSVPSLTAFDRPAASARLAGGCDGLETLEPRHLSGRDPATGQAWGVTTLEAEREVSIVAMPDIMAKPHSRVEHRESEPRCDVLDEGRPPLPPLPRREPEYPPVWSDDEVGWLQEQMVQHCTEQKNRMAVLDPRPEDRTPAQTITWREKFDTSYAALYYPWILVPDPLQLDGQLVRPVPPSGHIAGLYAGSDLRWGVHKPPANEALQMVQDVWDRVGDPDHGVLNARHVNVLRAYEGRGIRAAGARTLSSDSQWRYVNVRRLLMMIRRSLEQQLQWIVYEPHNRALRGDVERVVRTFLDSLWREGYLDGATADEAYHVRCDESTNPSQITDQGQLVCEIGVLPPWPAEYVRVLLRVSERGPEAVEAAEGPNG
jgi:hypothetical protein